MASEWDLRHLTCSVCCKGPFASFVSAPLSSLPRPSVLVSPCHDFVEFDGCTLVVLFDLPRLHTLSLKLRV